MNNITDLTSPILAMTRTPEFEAYLTDLLVCLCQVNTTPNSDVSVMRAAESAAFDILEAELAQLSFAAAKCERRAINPGIVTHRNYSQLHFTKTPACPAGLTPEQAYAGRCNLLYMVPAGASSGTALNAHIDVVHPYFPPRVENGIVYSRGACDDKGSVVALAAALKVLSRVLPAAGKRLRDNVVAMFVVEEETGGNGSLSLAVDRELKRLYDSILVLECTDNVIHPANRGAVWYRADLKCPGVSLFELFAFINEEMENEGRAIKAESRHALFPQRPVQTCHGIIGPYGEHPSRICGDVSFRVRFGAAPAAPARALVQDLVDSALAEYIALYGDKTRFMDPVTGKPKVHHHLDVVPEGTAVRIDVHGSTGHMGSILENDGAITKMAHLVRWFVRSKAKLRDLARSEVNIELVKAENVELLTLEGGQGFVPTHDITEVMKRMADAAVRGADAYLRLIGSTARAADAVQVTYDKLHNAAFDGDPDSLPMRNALAAAKACGMWKDLPVSGWTVSCDSRIFATEYPGMPVLTCGAGRLAHAHADQEQLKITDLRNTVEFLALYMVLQAGTV